MRNPNLSSGLGPSKGKERTKTQNKAVMEPGLQNPDLSPHSYPHWRNDADSSERSSDQPKITQQVRGKARIPATSLYSKTSFIHTCGLQVGFLGASGVYRRVAGASEGR